MVKALKVFLPDSGLLAHLAGVTEYADEGMVAANQAQIVIAWSMSVTFGRHLLPTCLDSGHNLLV